MFRLLFILTCCVVVASCSPKRPQAVVAEERPEDFAYTPDTIADPYADIYAWQGNVNGQTPVLMWYKEFGNVLKGVVVYTEHKNATPIPVLGTIEKSRYRILEIWPDGTISRIWHLLPHTSATEGTWRTPNTDTQYHVSLMHIDTAVSIPSVRVTGDISGTYVYKYKPAGAYAKCIVKQVDDSVRITFVNGMEQTTNATAYEVTLKLKENEAVYYPYNNNTSCPLRISFYDSFMHLQYDDTKPRCQEYTPGHGFGLFVKTQ